MVRKTTYHEPFESDGASWPLETDGPLSGANGVLPWLVIRFSTSSDYEEWYLAICVDAAGEG
jgi:hypothetical protein